MPLSNTNLMRLAFITAMNVEHSAVQRACAGRADINVFRVGIAAKHVPAARQIGNCSAIILAGLAGGLDPELKTGDVVVDDISHETLPRLPYRYGKISCCNEIVGTVREKHELFARTGALAVEMENDVVRRLAREVDVPYMHIRAIADTAEDVLDPELIKCLDEYGRVKSIRLIKHLPALPGLARKSKIACNSLTQAIDHLLKQLP